MSEIKLNLKDSNEAIHGTAHGSVGEAVVAALSAEPETIAELEAALERFIKPLDDRKCFASFHNGLDEEAWDAGIVIVDLAARVVAAESSYLEPGPRGEVWYHDGTQATDVRLFYTLPDDWLFVDSVAVYSAVCEKRRRLRASPPLDTRQILYGSPLTEFIVKECLEARDRGAAPSFGGARARTASSKSDPTPAQEDLEEADDEQPIPQIHASWLITPRADLRGKTPREVILEKLDFIDLDLESRARQWSLLGEGPPPLSRTSFAYLFAGFGTHEYVVHYYLVRHLVRKCWEQVRTEEQVDMAAETSRLERIKEAWLNEPLPEFDERVPSALIESARRRIPIVLSHSEMMVDENCELCQMLGEATWEDMGPGFWYLDGCNMDDDYAFSTYRTIEEWEEEQRSQREFSEEFKRKWALENRDSATDGELPGSDDDQANRTEF